MPYADKQVQREYQREWMRKRREEYFKDKVCEFCGSSDRLELDHKDRSTKVSHRIWSWSKERREAELAKCRPLCYDCHTRKSATEVPLGEYNGRSVLTDDLVKELRQVYNLGSVTYRQLADSYNIPRATIHFAVTGQTWKHIN